MTRPRTPSLPRPTNDPVHSTRPPGSGPPRVIAGIDGSWPARAALHWAARYARATGAVLHAVRVLEWPIGFTNTNPGGARPTLHVPDSDLDQSYRLGMERIFAEVDPLPGWVLTFAEGPTAPTLVRLVEEADLLVLGSRVHAASGDARTGDLGRYCTNHASRPVVTVPVEYLEQQPPSTRDPGPSTYDRHPQKSPRSGRASGSPPSLRKRLKARALARWADDGGQ